MMKTYMRIPMHLMNRDEPLGLHAISTRAEPTGPACFGAFQVLEGPEAFDTATIVVKYKKGRTAMIDVCRQATYGYDQRAEVCSLYIP